jgi:hypothetical protein
METPQPVKDIPSLIAFVEALNKEELNAFLDELKTKPGPFSNYFARLKEDWEKLSKELTGYSISGCDIYGALHSHDQGTLTAIPKLCEADKFYDIFEVFSSKPTSIVGAEVDPICEVDEDEQEKEAILNESNQLWRKNFDGSLLYAAKIGSSENVVDDYVHRVISSVSFALKLNLRLE